MEREKGKEERGGVTAPRETLYSPHHSIDVSESEMLIAKFEKLLFSVALISPPCLFILVIQFERVDIPSIEVSIRNCIPPLVFPDV